MSTPAPQNHQRARPQRVLRCVQENPGKTTPQIVDKLRAYGWLDEAVKTTLASLKYAGKLHKTDKGEWLPVLSTETRTIPAAAAPKPVLTIPNPAPRNEATAPSQHAPPQLREAVTPPPYAIRVQHRRPRGSLYKLADVPPETSEDDLVKLLVKRSFTSAGRSLFEVQDGQGNSVTMICDEDSPEMRGGVQGINATPARAKTLLLTAIEHWGRNLIAFKATSR